MSIYFFKDIDKSHSFLGGKGFTLGLLKNAGFNIPDGLILTEAPTSDHEWENILNWWRTKLSAPLAVRSSAIGEDSSEQSFAGQNSTFLNIDTEAALKKAILNCFDSVNKISSALYRDHFLKNKMNLPKMNVVLQIMINPLISGVFFSSDPRNNDSGWIVEAIEGLGEDLVSGKKTPWHFEENKLSSTQLFDIKNLVETGISVRDFLGVEIDMEWAIDHQNKLHVLQARPITALGGKAAQKRLIETEMNRLNSLYPKDTIWDGGTFAEWNGPPSELTFSIWKEAFSKSHAFSKSLKKLGYLGLDDELPNPGRSLLERIFNMGYVNISMLIPFYYGKMPYQLVFDNGPSLKLNLKKLNFSILLNTPVTIYRMIKVALEVSTKRNIWLTECEKQLSIFSSQFCRVNDPNYYKDYKENELLDQFKKEIEDFYTDTLMWPLVLTTLIESTTQNLKRMLKGVIPKDEIEATINKWLANGIHSVTAAMTRDYRNASERPKNRIDFLYKYGHRGPGELELSHPRWIELGEKSFYSTSEKLTKVEFNAFNVESEIGHLNSYKKQVIEKEWALLCEMLELREKWKMQLMSPYGHIRFMALEISRRFNLGDQIFWFSFQEILNKNFNLNLAEKRNADCELSKSISLPPILELKKLEELLKNNQSTPASMLMGIPLSPGLVYGEVRVVTDPEHVQTEAWPLNTIIVAESTDPGWTGLFLKSKGVIVEKGGVLSHCAIVAREINLPAVSGIKQCHLRLKDGDKIWLDGNSGRINLA